MLAILILLACGGFFGLMFNHFVFVRKGNDLTASIFTFCIVSTTFALIASLLIYPVSYFTYVDARTFFHTTQEQYSSSVKLCGDNKILEITASTDIVNNGYQEGYKKFLIDLRNSIIDYNETITSKRIMGENWLLKPLIYQPDKDMIPIKLINVAELVDMVGIKKPCRFESCRCHKDINNKKGRSK